MLSIKKNQSNVNDIINKKYVNKMNNDYQEIINYVLDGGKRLRPIIVQEINKKLNKKFRKQFKNTSKKYKSISTKDLSILIELIHSASLIIDDLPCMDDDSERRNKPTFHIKYGNSGAQLVSYLFFTNSIDLISDCIDKLKATGNFSEDECNERGMLLYKNIFENVGIDGATMGQYLDILPNYFDKSQINTNENVQNIFEKYKNEDLILDIIHKKTTALFDISFLGSYILSGGDLQNISKLKKAVKCFGLAFQISDDYLDFEQDSNRKIEGVSPNYMINYGKEKTVLKVKESIVIFRKIMIELDLWSKLFNDICLYLVNRVD